MTKLSTNSGLIIGSGLKESAPCVVMVLEMRCTI